MRRVAPTDRADKRSDVARTGAPASASTVLIPTVRNSVLLPDMLDPLTTSSCVSVPRWMSFATILSDGNSGWPSFTPSNSARDTIDESEPTISGNGSSGCSY